LADMQIKVCESQMVLSAIEYISR